MKEFELIVWNEIRVRICLDLVISKVQSLKEKGSKGQITHLLTDAWSWTVEAQFISLKVLNSC